MVVRSLEANECFFKSSRRFVKVNKDFLRKPMKLRHKRNSVLERLSQSETFFVLEGDVGFNLVIPLMVGGTRSPIGVEIRKSQKSLAIKCIRK